MLGNFDFREQLCPGAASILAQLCTVLSSPYEFEGSDSSGSAGGAFIHVPIISSASRFRQLSYKCLWSSHGHPGLIPGRSPGVTAMSGIVERAGVWAIVW